MEKPNRGSLESKEYSRKGGAANPKKLPEGVNSASLPPILGRMQVSPNGSPL